LDGMRHPMAHARARRNVYAMIGGEPGPHEARTGFYVGPKGAEVTSRPLIEMCAHFSTDHVEAFLTSVRSGAVG
jgi:hypothetical protein